METVANVVAEVERREGYRPPLAFGIGIRSESARGKVLEVFYPVACYNSDHELAAILARETAYRGTTGAYVLSAEALLKASAFAQNVASSLPDGDLSRILERLSHSVRPIVVTFITEDKQPSSTDEVYLKLTLLSMRLVKPRAIELEGLFKVLPTVAWTSEGAIDLDELPSRQLEARLGGRFLEVYAIDKFPMMINHVVPSQIRIADGARVRLGAYLGPGTTVMQEGFVNFNAGTEGPNMVDGRIQAGAFVEAGSDLGGACSVMGTLYRDGTTITIGRDCVIGANAGAGISLGDECTIEAGLYVTSGTKVELLDKTGKKMGTVKARDLSGKRNLLFRRNSTTGRVEALESKAVSRLNDALHSNN